MVTADELMALASLAGQAVVTAAVTDAWETVRRKFAHFFGRGDADRTGLAERRLDQTHEQLAGASETDVDQLRVALAERWTARLADLLDEEPSAEAELRSLVREIQDLLPTDQVSIADHSVTAGRDVKVERIKADRGGFAAGIVTGDVTLPDPTGRESAAN